MPGVSSTPCRVALRIQFPRDGLQRQPFPPHIQASREARNLAKRFTDHADSYFRFITEPDVDPTNNLAEQAIRFVAFHRRMTQGTRGEKGQHWCERLWTVATTCVQQGRSVFAFLLEAVQAHFQGNPFPSLLSARLGIMKQSGLRRSSLVRCPVP
jgi:hypothetical protein